jgi:hypothetical protein
MLLPFLSSSVSWTSVSDLDILVLNGMLTDGCAWIHAVDVIDAAADGENLDDTKAHDVGTMFLARELGIDLYCGAESVWIVFVSH